MHCLQEAPEAGDEEAAVFKMAFGVYVEPSEASGSHAQATTKVLRGDPAAAPAAAGADRITRGPDGQDSHADSDDSGASSDPLLALDLAEEAESESESKQSAPESARAVATSDTHAARAARARNTLLLQQIEGTFAVSYTHLTLPTTPYV